MKLRVGTRASLLAKTQTGHVVAALVAAAPEVAFETVLIRTEGDRLQSEPPAPGEKLAKGLFTGALEAALAEGRIDVAVHSAKDLPTELGGGMTVAAIPARVDPRDVLLTAHDGFDGLPAGARVGTGSPRRAAQIAALREDLEVQPIRGNVDTRIAKLRGGEFDAIVLAAAGLLRLGRSEEISQAFEVDELVPAPGQGALAVETRDDATAALVRGWLDHAATRICVQAERAALDAVGGGCSLPLGAHAVLDGERLRLRAVLFDESFRRSSRVDVAGPADEAAVIGERAAARLRAGIDGEG